MENIYIKDDGKTILPEGFIPEPGQKIIVLCPKCGAEYEVEIGGFVSLYENKDDYECKCKKCKYTFSEYIQLSDFFTYKMVNILYSAKFEKCARELQFYCESAEKGVRFKIANMIGAFTLGGVMNYDTKYIGKSEYNLVFKDDIELLSTMCVENVIKQDMVLICDSDFEVKRLKKMELKIELELE